MGKPYPSDLSDRKKNVKNADKSLAKETAARNKVADVKLCTVLRGLDLEERLMLKKYKNAQHAVQHHLESLQTPSGNDLLRPLSPYTNISSQLSTDTPTTSFEKIDSVALCHGPSGSPALSQDSNLHTGLPEKECSKVYNLKRQLEEANEKLDSAMKVLLDYALNHAGKTNDDKLHVEEILISDKHYGYRHTDEYHHDKGLTKVLFPGHPELTMCIPLDELKVGYSRHCPSDDVNVEQESRPAPLADSDFRCKESPSAVEKNCLKEVEGNRLSADKDDLNAQTRKKRRTERKQHGGHSEQLRQEKVFQADQQNRRSSLPAAPCPATEEQGSSGKQRRASWADDRSGRPKQSHDKLSLPKIPANSEQQKTRRQKSHKTRNNSVNHHKTSKFLPPVLK